MVHTIKCICQNNNTYNLKFKIMHILVSVLLYASLYLSFWLCVIFTVYFTQDDITYSSAITSKDLALFGAVVCMFWSLFYYLTT